MVGAGVAVLTGKMAGVLACVFCIGTNPVGGLHAEKAITSTNKILSRK